MDLSFRSRKRSRDDDDDVAIRLDGVPADKKQRNASAFQLPAWLNTGSEPRPSIHRAHSLPFRLDNAAVITPSPHLPPPVFEAPEADESPTESNSSNSPDSFISLPAPPELTDVEMNMDHQVSIAGSASPPSPFTQPQHLRHLRPDKLNPPGLDSFSGRIPTPIHSNFNLEQPPPLPRSRTDSFLPTAATNPIHLNTSLSRFAAPMKQILENDYRMPSPIVESPLIEDSMDLSDFPSSQLSRLSVSQDSMDLDDTVWSQHYMGASSDGLSFDVVPPTPTTPGRTGRARSGAFSASSTHQDKGGRRVVFGYREDCDKCRMRFPGHFAHFV